MVKLFYVFLYANDLVMLSSTVTSAGLQNQLNKVHSYYTALDVHTNNTKMYKLGFHPSWGRILVTIYGVPHPRFLEFPQIFPHLCFFSVSAILVNFKMRNSPKF